MNEVFDWRQAIANLPPPPDPIGFTPKDPGGLEKRESRGERLSRQIEELKEYQKQIRELRARLKKMEEVPLNVKADLAERDANAGHTLRQWEWRERNFMDPEDRKGIGMTLHLRPSEIACLDWIARRLYFANPCTETDEPSNWVPSRAQAIRELIANYMERRGVAYIPMDEMIATQEAWGAFWIREASYRRAGVTKKMAGLVKPPSMPAL